MSFSKDKKSALKVKAAYYYYKKNMKLADIASELNISRVTLNNLLKDALNEGIVRIEIADTGNTLKLLQLEETVKNRFELQDIKIIDTPVSGNNAYTTNEIARAAAELLDSKMHNGIKLSISWGRTLELMVQYLQGNDFIHDIEVYTLLGAQGIVNMQMQPSTIAYSILQKYSGTGYIMNAPFSCDSKEDRDLIMKQKDVDLIVKQSRNSDLTLVGIGPTPNEYLNKDDMRYPVEVVKELKDYNVCGDICSNFYDIYGHRVNTPLSSHFVKVDLDDIKEHKCVVGIGGGKHKISSILGALNGHYLDILVTDKNTIIDVIKAADLLGI